MSGRDAAPSVQAGVGPDAIMLNVLGAYVAIIWHAAPGSQDAFVNIFWSIVMLRVRAKQSGDPLAEEVGTTVL